MYTALAYSYYGR